MQAPRVSIPFIDTLMHTWAHKKNQDSEDSVVKDGAIFKLI